MAGSLEEQNKLITYLKGLRRDSGGYADSDKGTGSMRATLSVIKAMEILDALEEDPFVIEFINACHHTDGGFSIDEVSDPTAFDTAVALISLKTLKCDDLLAYLPSAIVYMNENAATQFDYFMMIAAYEECQILEPISEKATVFFETLLETSMAQKHITSTAVASSALLRAGKSLSASSQVIELIVTGQDTKEGGFGDDDSATMFSTYCCMRMMVLQKQLPNTKRLMAYLDSLKTKRGYSDTAGGTTSAGAVYQNISMREWVKELQRVPVELARNGDVEGLTLWLKGGGDVNTYDSEGWTPLLAASARGKSKAVDFLLNHDLDGLSKADPQLRYVDADALPIYLAGQSGDLETVKCLLKSDPSQLHAYSKVNGHTVLLQAAFYGKQKHMVLASYLLDNADVISGVASAVLEVEQAKMLSATNVRGYNPITMQELWHNQPMLDLLNGYESKDIDSKSYYENLLLEIASSVALTERIIKDITLYLDGKDLLNVEKDMDKVLKHPEFRIDTLGGPLLMTPLIHAITGVDVGNEARSQRRYYLADKLLKAGADPSVIEKHPMAIGAVIRASVLNNFDLLKLIQSYMTEQTFEEEMNTSPAVNGLTAMHDAVHRALTSPPGERKHHLEQIRWMIEKGARLDIPDHTGQSAYELAESARRDSVFPTENVVAVFNIIENSKGDQL